MSTEARNPNSTNIDELTTLEMLQVINNEDATVAKTIQAILPDIAQVVDAITAKLKSGGRLIYVGAGTSGRLGILDAVECVPTFSVSPDLVVGLIAGGERAVTQAVEGAEDDKDAGGDDLRNIQLSANDAVVGIAASGRTPYVIGALETANEIGALTVAISCNHGAPILDIAQHGICAPVGSEVITGSTRMKAGTAQKLILNMLSTSVMIKRGKVYGNLMVDVMQTNSKLVDRAKRIVSEVTGASYERAGVVLEQAQNSVKVAIVIELLGISADDACQRLDEHDGILRKVITPLNS